MCPVPFPFLGGTGFILGGSAPSHVAPDHSLRRTLCATFSFLKGTGLFLGQYPLPRRSRSFFKTELMCHLFLFEGYRVFFKVSYLIFIELIFKNLFQTPFFFLEHMLYY